MGVDNPLQYISRKRNAALLRRMSELCSNRVRFP